MKPRRPASFTDTLRANDRALQELSAFSGKPIPEGWLNNTPPKKTRKPATQSLEPLEHVEQATVCSWWFLACRGYGLPRFALYAVPNGQVLMRSARNPHAVMQYLRKEGFRDGAPDLVLDAPSNRKYGLRLEMKRLTKGAQTDEQRDFQLYFESRGYQYSLCRGADEAIATIKAYLA